ncbi:hypothetical protein POM88_024005 [Heracleum sosnowskyi]|uniref:J domain-containing protein n=1 Tax=Heracleum sosnowskyi TaxID=360622 RepID=A0AAD8IIC0_9APIA|nr:hypothetical protein POM88_024005 [Heracleum sosnowskyi]
MHPYNLNPTGSDSHQYLQIAENLLKTRDLIGTKSFALKAQESDPNSESANQILAIVDTLIAGDKQISGNNLDWYSILQLARRTHDSELIASQYKRLGNLLNPNRNVYAFAEHAYKLVTEAYVVLSNPSRKFQFDNEFGNSNATHFNFIPTRSSGLFEGTEMQQRNQLIGGSGSSGQFEGTEMHQGRNKVIGGGSGSSGQFEGTEMHQGRNKVIGGSSGQFEGTEMQQGRNKVIGGSSGQFEGTEMQQGRSQLIGGSGGTEMQQGRNQLIGGSSGTEMQQGRNNQIGGSSGTEMQQGRNKHIGGGSSVHFDFMQDGSGGELHLSSPMQFVQQQQGFGQQALQFFGEDEREQDGPIMTSQLHWSNQGKQPQQQLVRPQPQLPLLRPHLQQTWFEEPEPEPQTHIQHTLPQSQPHILPQSHQPSHWAQSQPNKPQPVTREQPTQPLHWAQHVSQQLPPLSQPQTQSWMQQALPTPQMRQSSIEPRPPPESREELQQPLGLSQQVPWLLPESREQPQQLLNSSQPVPQVLPLLQPQSWMQEPLPSPQIQTSSHEPQSQPEKTPPESGEGVNNGEHFNFGENADNHENNVNVEEPANFWTSCPYCFYMYEYAGIYVDCTLRCQNCKKAIHAARIEAPPAVADGEDAYICCWGYFPIGVSMSDLEKRKADASNWQPFSKMYVVPRGGNTSPQGGTEFAFPQGGNTSKSRKPRKPRKQRNSGPRIYIDEDDEEAIFDGISSNDESEYDEDWRYYAPKNKKARRYTKKVSTAEKVKQPQPLEEMVQDGNTGNLDSGVVAQDVSGVSVPDAAIPIVPDTAVPSVPVPKAAVDDADKKKVSFSIRKQPGRVAKDLGKLDGVVSQEVQGVDVPDVAAPIVLVPDVAAPIVLVAEADKKVMGEAEKIAVEGSNKKKVSVPTRKQPGRVAKDMGS